MITKRKRGRPKRDGPTIASIAKENGISERTAYRRFRMADDYEALPEEERKAIDAEQKTLAQALRDTNPPTLTKEVVTHLKAINRACKRFDDFLSKHDNLSGVIADERWNSDDTEPLKQRLGNLRRYFDLWLLNR